MSAPLCKCGCKKSWHSPESENYDAPWVCQNPDCKSKCQKYEPDADGDDITIDDENWD
jgi:hypothetical protein